MKKIHEDQRGEIYIITGDIQHEEITLFVTNKGFARGGCIHRINDEFCVVLEGEIRYHRFGMNIAGIDVGEYVVTLNEGDKIMVTHGIPHHFISMTKSVVMEWGPSGEEKKERDSETRKIVDEINQKMIKNENP